MQSVNDVSGSNEGLESGSHTYTYDEIGNLTSDREITEIKWTVYGKIASVKKRDNTEIEYKYDGTGQRIYKKVVSSSVSKETHYARDGSGNVLAIYENKILDELVIYGSSRLGSYNGKTEEGKRTLGNKKYELSNHLGNVLAVISDNKIGIDNVGNDFIADYYEPLVISESDYYPFGMAMKERSFSNEEYRFGFNGMEKEGNLGEGKTDFGARIYDEKLSRFLSVDRMLEKFPFQSPYVFAANTPLQAVDIAGDSVWVTTTTTNIDMGNGKTLIKIEHTIHIEGAVLDLAGLTESSGFGCSGAKPACDKFITNLESEFNSQTVTDTKVGIQNTSVVTYNFDVNIRQVSSMSEVKSTDHLLVLVDDVLGGADKSLGGGDAGGLAQRGGQIAYLELGSWNWMIESAIHELSHNMGLTHVKDEKNYLSYGKDRSQFSFEQLQEVLVKSRNGELNLGENYEYSSKNTKNVLWHTSTNEDPYKLNTQKGEKIPKKLKNP